MRIIAYVGEMASFEQTIINIGKISISNGQV